jgi:carbon storage regulator CsrA
MLILSRRPNETICFPQLGISVSIVSVKGSRVQVGIDAPPEIQILRHELQADAQPNDSKLKRPSELASSPQCQQPRADQENHNLRNRLNKATLGLHLAQKQLATGQIEAADRTLAIALSRLAELEESQVTKPAIRPTQSAAPKSKPLATSLRQRVEECTGKVNREFSTVDIDGSDAFASFDTQQRIDVLLVEDDPNERALLRGLLEMEGYHVHAASNGREAIHCLNHLRPKFVLLDMLMPECDGRETLERIRQIPALANLPVFAVSGSSPNSVGLAIGQDGVADWFPKPLNAPRLVQHLRDRMASLSS